MNLFRFQCFVNIVKEWWKQRRVLPLKNFPLSALTRHLGISSETIPLFEKNLQIRKNGLFSLHQRQNSYYIIAEFRLDLFILQHVPIEGPAAEHSLFGFPLT
jgi:hypothetical protein